MIVPPVKDDLKLMSIGFFLEDKLAGDVARADAAPRARAVPLRRALGELDTLVVDMPAGHRRRLDLARAAFAARRGRDRDDAAAAGPGDRGPRGADGAEDEHAPARRGREHERRGLRLWRRQELADDLHVPLLGSIPLDPSLREAATRRAAGDLESRHTAAVAISEVADAIAETRRSRASAL